MSPMLLIGLGVGALFLFASSKKEEAPKVTTPSKNAPPPGTTPATYSPPQQHPPAQQPPAQQPPAQPPPDFVGPEQPPDPTDPMWGMTEEERQAYLAWLATQQNQPPPPPGGGVSPTDIENLIGGYK